MIKINLLCRKKIRNYIEINIERNLYYNTRRLLKSKCKKLNSLDKQDKYYFFPFTANTLYILYIEN